MIISICDDSPIGRTIVKEMVLRYREKRQIPDLEILEYDSPVPLEEDLEKIESDMYLLDIFFPDGNGIDLARKIRLHYHYNPIVFITASKKDTMNAFNVHALRYFVKPVRPRELYDMLDYVFADARKKEKKYFPVRTVDGERKLRYSSIMYVERDGQTLRITTSSGRVYQSVTLRESFSAKLKPLLEDERFVQTHVSFVVNLDAVKACFKNTVLMQDGREIPISRKYNVSVKESFHQYYT